MVYQVHHSGYSRKIATKTEQQRLCGVIKSDPYTMLQGIIQGGNASGSDFKHAIHEALQTSIDSATGFHIGDTYVSTLACADDVIFIAASEADLQKQLLLFNDFMNRERFNLHPKKSSISIYNPTALELQFYCEAKPWKINQQPATISHEFIHLGVNYNLEKPGATSNSTVEARLKTGRNTTYSLMGAGLHGTNGVNPTVSNHIYNVYVVPCVVYSLKFISLNAPDLKKLETAHNSLLRNIQSLPSRTAISALHILLGTLPLQATLEQRQLATIPSLLQNSTILEVIIRQIATKSSASHSWVIATQKLLHKYDLPNFMEIIASEISPKKM